MEQIFLTLTQLGIHLKNSEDLLHWSGGDRSGKLTAQNLYASIANLNRPTNITGCKNHIWSWRILQKIKFFIWMLFENKLNTWDTLLRKGWSGPIFFHLCQLDSETAEHIFINYQFTKQFWLKIALAINLHTNWVGENIAD